MAGMAGIKGSLVGCVLAAALAFAPMAGGDAGPLARSQTDFNQSALVVQSDAELGTTIGFNLASSPTAAPTGQIDVFVPTGYQLAPPQVGAGIGLALFADTDPANFSLTAGTMTVVDPSTVDATSALCDQTAHLAVWKASLQDTQSRTSTMFVFVDAPAATDSTGTAYHIRFCPPAPATGATLGLIGLTISSDVLAEPQTPGTYTWRAFLTPDGPGTTTPDPTQTYELRAEMPLPQSLTLQAVYNPKTRRASLTGQFTELGHPQAGVDVSFDAESAHVNDAEFGPTKTNAAGRFTFSWPITEKTDFTASVEQNDPVPCTPEQVPPPGGCASETTSVPAEAGATALIPPKGAPVSAFRAADQALARRLNVQQSDLPTGWKPLTSASAAQVEPCPETPFKESTLTLAGAADSPVYYSGSLVSGLASASFSYVLSWAKVWKTAADAKAAYLQEHPVSRLRCLIEGSGVTTARQLSLPRVGRASSAYRLEAIDTDAGGSPATTYLDLIEILGKRSLVSVVITSVGAPPSFETALVEKIGRRVAGV